MTDKELIQALKHCGDPDEATCYGCPARKMCRENPGLPIDRMAADRLEALLAENEMLYREVAQLKEECDHFRDLTKKLWCEKRYCKETDANASKVESFRCTGEKCPLELGNICRCTMRNCPWRTTPSTEGVE